MNKRFLLFFLLLTAQHIVFAQSANDLLKSVLGSNSQTLSTDDVAAGLKEALNNGINNGTAKLSAVDGFFKDAAIKILLPPEAEKMEKTLRGFGLGKIVDDAVLSMNRAAEDAAKSAAPIFLDAVKQMSINDAWGILKGGDTAATVYLKNKTTASLTAAFKPVIDKSLEKTDATKYWNKAFTTYNKFTFNKINPDLSAYVTEKALYGIFHEVGEQEKLIRKDPLARTSDMLKKVFAN